MPDIPDVAPVYLKVGESSAPLLVGHLVRREGEAVPVTIAGFLRALADEIEKVPAP